jgi:hypothetical protein
MAFRIQEHQRDPYYCTLEAAYTTTWNAGILAEETNPCEVYKYVQDDPTRRTFSRDALVDFDQKNHERFH